MLLYMKNSITLVFKYATKSATFILLEKLFSACLTPLSLICIGSLVESIYNAIEKNGNSINILIVGSILIIITLIRANFSWFEKIQNINLQKNMSRNFSLNVINKFLKIDYPCFEDCNNNDTIQRMGKTPHDKIIDMFNNTIDIISKIITIIGLELIFIKVSIFFAMSYLIIIILLIYTNYKAIILMNSLFNSQTKSEREMEYLCQLLTNKNTLLESKIFNSTNYLFDLWLNKINIVLKDRLKTTIKSQKYYAINSCIILIWVGFLLYTLMNSVENRMINLSLFVSLIVSLSSLLDVSSEFASACANISQKYLQLEHFNRFNLFKERVMNNEAKDYLDNITIEFDKVSFIYPGSDKVVLDNVSFTIVQGEKVALVGENGAGKSTIIKLLLRLYQPTSGEILINGININIYTELQLKRIFSVVFQDYVNYYLTLRENVVFGDISKIKEELDIEEALKKSKASELISLLDNNLGKIYDDGIDLSGGQWQKVAIARAIIANSHVIILDEPTASLDPVAESIMYSTFHEALKEKQYIMISHRLASARLANKILVIDQGKIVETGPHDELILNNYIYKKMWDAQSHWYQEGVYNEV